MMAVPLDKKRKKYLFKHSPPNFILTLDKIVIDIINEIIITMLTKG